MYFVILGVLLILLNLAGIGPMGDGLVTRRSFFAATG